MKSGVLVWLQTTLDASQYYYHYEWDKCNFTELYKRRASKTLVAGKDYHIWNAIEEATVDVWSRWPSMIHSEEELALDISTIVFMTIAAFYHPTSVFCHIKIVQFSQELALPFLISDLDETWVSSNEKLLFFLGLLCPRWSRNSSVWLHLIF